MLWVPVLDGHNSDAKLISPLTVMLTTDFVSDLPMELKLTIIQHVAMESSLTECVDLMVLSRAFYEAGFAALIACKPSTFFDRRTRALFFSAMPDEWDSIPRETGRQRWDKLWTNIIPKLPSLRHLETFNDFSPPFSVRKAAIQALASLENLTSLTLNGMLPATLVDLIHQNMTPTFPRLTHLKLVTRSHVQQRARMLFQSKAFPIVSHLMVVVHQIHVGPLAEYFGQLKVLIFAVQGIDMTIQNTWAHTLLAQYPNVVVVFWEGNELSLFTRPVWLEAFKREVNGEYASLWNRAEREILLRAEAKNAEILK
ncbi:hypothetical protein DL96DRAFT_1684148 [Flagelloscypha sp. PMI_526]|nr:hypothetical protein DL96DRAFT_1684148 [Flagelloscypha sp. PMI_526]